MYQRYGRTSGEEEEDPDEEDEWEPEEEERDEEEQLINELEHRTRSWTSTQKLLT